MSTEEAPKEVNLAEAPKEVMARAKNFSTKAGKREQGSRTHGDPLKALTINLVDTYAKCSPDFKYSLKTAPRRVLTKLSKGVHNNANDNAEHDYICRVGDQIANPDGQAYEILERLGHGSFGQVLKCQKGAGSYPIALKIIKNKPAYFHQALVEVRILQMLNQEFDPDDEHRMVRMLDFFVYRKHLCIAFELLSVNLYDVLKQNNFRGVSMALIRVLTEQLLKAMRCLRRANVIHCDLKPENVLLSDMQHTKIKLIDFGSACFENHTVYSYIQSRFYRSPEVLVGLPYTSAIDMWSLGCICAELFLGLPIFPGHSEYDQVCRITEVLGLPPAVMLDGGKHTRRYFKRIEERVEENVDSGGSASSGAPVGSPEKASVDDEGTAAAAASEPKAEAKSCDQGESQSKGESQSQSLFALLKQKLNMVGAEAEDSSEGKEASHSTTAPPESVDSALSTVAPPESGSSAPPETSPDYTQLEQSQRGRVPSSGDEPQSSSQIDEASKEEQPGNGPKDPNRPSVVKSSRSWKRGGRIYWRLKAREEFERTENKKEPTPKKYYNFKSLEQMVELVPFKQSLSKRALREEQERRVCFLQFLLGLFQINPEERWTPKQASLQSFVTGSPFDSDWQPPQDESVRPAQDTAMHGLWGHLCAGIPLPDDHPEESYRPPINKMSEDFFKQVALSRDKQQLIRGGSGGEQPKAPNKPGASFCSSASSTGSTPTGGRGMRASPYSTGSPLSACGPQARGQLSHGSLPNGSGTTVTPVSSPHGSTASTANTRRTPQGPVMHARVTGSRDGSRGSSPWHLATPQSDMSATTSQPSGSDSCGEMMGQAWGGSQCNYDETGSEGLSQSDTLGAYLGRSQSESDCMTPQSQDAAGNSARGSSGAEDVRDGTTKDPKDARWENIKSEIDRGQVSQKHIKTRLESTLSPGNTGTSTGASQSVTDFRAATGMNESGPVVPRRAPGGEEAGAASASTAGYPASRTTVQAAKGKRPSGTGTV